jgi:hypothetical protein
MSPTAKNGATADADLYAPPAPPTVEVEGETFAIREMSVQGALRFYALLGQYTVQIQGVAAQLQGRSGAEQAATIVETVGVEGVTAMVALALSTPERPIDAAWVQARWTRGLMAWPIKVLRLWLEQNADGLQELLGEVAGLVTLFRPPAPATASRTPSAP